MSTLINTFLYGMVVMMSMQNHLVIAAVCAIAFTYRVSALWLIPLGFAIDGYFGAFYDVPVYTSVALGWYVCTELLRPRLLSQSQTI